MVTHGVAETAKIYARILGQSRRLDSVRVEEAIVSVGQNHIEEGIARDNFMQAFHSGAQKTALGRSSASSNKYSLSSDSDMCISPRWG